MDVEQPDERHASLSIPAKPTFVGLARLALAAVCRLVPLGPAEVADLKLAITEAAVSLMGSRGDERVEFDFRLEDDRLELEIRGPGAPGPADEEPAIVAAILDATADEVSREPGRVHLVKRLAPAT